MSQEIVLIATITVAPGKQKRMDELFANSFRYMQENEPGTLEFRVYQETKDEIPRAVLLERYESQEALEKHRSSESYKKFFQTMQEEEILSGMPEMITAKNLYGFSRS